MSAFVAVGPRAFGVRLRDDIIQLLRQLTSEMRDLLLVGDDDALRRLYPTTYPEDEQRNAEYSAFAHDQLLAARLQALDVVEETLGNDELTDEQLSCWMRVFNEMRLVLGTRLDISEEDHEPRGPDDPDAPAFELYRLLTFVVDQAVEALAMGLGDATTFEGEAGPG